MDNIFRALKKEELNLDSINSIRKEIYKIENINNTIRNFEKTSLLHKKSVIKRSNPARALNTALLNSKIKERQEITEKLKILLYHLSLLKSTKLTKDYNAAKRCMHQFMTNNFTKVSVVLNDITNFKADIKELDKNYKELTNSHPLTLDNKLNMEFAYKGLVNNLSSINNKQKQITKILGKSFVEESKELINNEDYRDFVDKN